MKDILSFVISIFILLLFIRAWMTIVEYIGRQLGISKLIKLILRRKNRIQRDWNFSDQDYICNFRSTGVLIRNNKILVQRDKDGKEYALPGGHVKIGETAEGSLIREYREETGANINCERLLWVEECFWKWNKKMANTIVFYYLISLDGDSDIPDNGEFVPQKDNSNVVLGWMPLETLHALTIYPSFIKEKIFNISNNIEHFITKE